MRTEAREKALIVQHIKLRNYPCLFCAVVTLILPVWSLEVVTNENKYRNLALAQSNNKELQCSQNPDEAQAKINDKMTARMIKTSQQQGVSFLGGEAMCSRQTRSWRCWQTWWERIICDTENCKTHKIFCLVLTGQNWSSHKIIDWREEN